MGLLGNNKRSFERTISLVCPPDKPVPDFEKWQQEHPRAIEILRSHGEHFTPARTKMPLAQVWRPMRVAAAAVIIVVAILALHNGSVHIVSPAFGVQDVLDAMKKANWVHYVVEVTGINVDANTAEEIPVGWQCWQSANPLRDITKHDNGNIYLTEANMGKTSRYDPRTNRITVEYRDPSSSQQTYAGIGDMYIKQIAEVERQGGEIGYEDSVYDGAAVRIISIHFASGQGLNTKMSIIVDPETYLPKRFSAEQKKSGGLQAALSGTFDYPETGPTDVYQAGAPRDAKVVIADNVTNQEFRDVIKRYNAARENLPKQRIEVVNRSWEGGRRCEIYIVYIDGKKERYESRHWVDELVDGIPASEDFARVLEWARTVRSDRVSVRIYDGEYICQADRDQKGVWEVKDREYAPEDAPSNSVLIVHGWPGILRGRVIQNDYATKGKLVCIENRERSFIKEGRLMHPACRRLYYLDPNHDYMCVRRESYSHRVPPPSSDGRPKVDELDFDPDSTPSEPSTIMEVVEFGRFDTGHRYPKKMKEQSIARQRGTEPVSGISLVTLYVNTDPEFPDGIFDSKNLTKAGILRIKRPLPETTGRRGQPKLEEPAGGGSIRLSF
jgi:hypothetical protein